MSRKITLKAATAIVTLCALTAGVAESASAASCTSNQGRCTTRYVDAGANRMVTYRATALIPWQPDLGNVQIMARSGRVIRNSNFWGDTRSVRLRTPTSGTYRCRVEAVGVNRGRVSCSIR